jgi:hypothetical protein
MTKVNSYMVSSLLSPIGGSADVDDDESAELSRVNGNNEFEVKRIIESYIATYFRTCSASYQKSAKQSLSYFLTTDNIDYEYIYYGCLISMDMPSDPRLLFQWIWEVLFPDEIYQIDNIDQYVVVDDISEPNSYLDNGRVQN